MLKLDPRTTALILIDVQNGTLALPMAPHGPAEIVAKSVALAKRFKEAGGILVLVRVSFSEGYADKPKPETDAPMVLPIGGSPAGWDVFPPEIASLRPDVVITKRQWSAFYGTELDLQLRRRGIASVVIGGLMTNFGVESTARDAWQNNYATIVAEDASSSASAELHRFAIEKTLPRVSRVRSTQEIIAALAI